MPGKLGFGVVSAVVPDAPAGISDELRNTTWYAPTFLTAYGFETPTFGPKGAVRMPKANNFGRIGSKFRSFSDDYYHRIYIVPSELDMGNVLATQTRDVLVWNAFLEPHALNNLTGQNSEGISVVAPYPAPTNFNGLEQRTYQFIIDNIGPPTIDALFTFQFTSQNYYLPVVGRRVILWPFVPQAKFKESLEWNTNVLRSYNTEQRIALRQAPRQSFSYSYILDKDEFVFARGLAKTAAGLVYGVPVWAELTKVGVLASGSSVISFDTSNKDFRVGGLLMVWDGATYAEAGEILSMTPSSVTLKAPIERNYSQALVMPLRLGRALGGFNFKRTPSQVTTAEVTFDATDNKDLSGTTSLDIFDTFDGKSVIVSPIYMVSDASEKVLMPVDVFDNGSAGIATNFIRPVLENTRSVTFELQNRADRWEFRKWLYGIRGKQKAFWLPSWNNDVTILSDSGGAGTTFTVTIEPIGYPQWYSNGPVGLMVVLNSGGRAYARAVSAATDVNGKEVLTLDIAFTAPFLASEVREAHFMDLVRFNADKVTLSYSNFEQLSISAPVLEVPE